MPTSVLILVAGGAISFLLAAASGFWLDAWMKAHPEAGPDRYRMTLHKEALWSSFLCFAIAGWIDRLPMATSLQIAASVSVVLTGWLAMGQYLLVARAGVKNAYTDPRPPGTRLLGGGALLVNLAAVAVLLLGAALAILHALS
jgi:hypothetical protein